MPNELIVLSLQHVHPVPWVGRAAEQMTERRRVLSPACRRQPMTATAGLLVYDFVKCGEVILSGGSGAMKWKRSSERADRRWGYRAA